MDRNTQQSLGELISNETPTIFGIPQGYFMAACAFGALFAFKISILYGALIVVVLNLILLQVFADDNRAFKAWGRSLKAPKRWSSGMHNQRKTFFYS